MKIQYKKGPCSHNQCCRKGDTHLPVVELRGGVQFVRGGDPVKVSDELGKKLIADHPGMFEEAGKARKPSVVLPRK